MDCAMVANRGALAERTSGGESWPWGTLLLPENSSQGRTGRHETGILETCSRNALPPKQSKKGTPRDGVSRF